MPAYCSRARRSFRSVSAWIKAVLAIAPVWSTSSKDWFPWRCGGLPCLPRSSPARVGCFPGTHCDGGLRVDLWQNVGEDFFRAVYTLQRQIMHEDLNRLPQDLVAAFSYRKSSMGFSRGNYINNIILRCLFSKDIAAPSSALISPQTSWGPKVTNPASFYCIDEVIGSFSHYHSNHLVRRWPTRP